MAAVGDSAASAWAAELLAAGTTPTTVLDIDVGDAAIVGSAGDVAELLDAACKGRDTTLRGDCSRG